MTDISKEKRDKLLATLERIEAAPEKTRRTKRLNLNPKVEQRVTPEGKLARGGWRGQPGSLAALDVHRGRTLIHLLPKCAGVTKLGKPCGKPKMRESEFCWTHNSPGFLSARTKKDLLWKPSRTRVLRRALGNLVATPGMVPEELKQQPVFMAVAEIAYNNRYIPRDSGTPLEVRLKHARRWEVAGRLTLELANAWHSLVGDGNHEGWHRAVEKARRLV